MKKVILILLFVGYTGLGVSRPAQGQSNSKLAVIVHKENPLEDLSFTELNRIFRLEQQNWSNKERITVLLPGPNQDERDRMIQKLYRMSDQAFRQYWISLSYRVQAISLPRPMVSCESTKRVISSLPNAISVVDSSCVDENVKVLQIEGRSPSERGYRL